jgi:hypothetical protein
VWPVILELPERAGPYGARDASLFASEMVTSKEFNEMMRLGACPFGRTLSVGKSRLVS